MLKAIEDTWRTAAIIQLALLTSGRQFDATELQVVISPVQQINPHRYRADGVPCRLLTVSFISQPQGTLLKRSCRSLLARGHRALK